MVKTEFLSLHLVRGISALSICLATSILHDPTVTVPLVEWTTATMTILIMHGLLWFVSINLSERQKCTTTIVIKTGLFSSGGFVGALRRFIGFVCLGVGLGTLEGAKGKVYAAGELYD